MDVAALRTWLQQAPPGTTLAASDVLELLEGLETDPTPRTSIRSGNGTPDRLLSAADVAETLGVSKRYVYANAPVWPFTRHLGRSVRFSANGLAAWLTRRTG